MKIKNRRALVCTCVLVLLGASACEVTNPLEGVELIVDVDDANVALGSEGVAVTFLDGQTVASTASIQNELDVDAVELNEIKLEPSFFTFAEGGAAKRVLLQESGTLTLVISMGLPPNGPLYPLPPVTVTIEDNVVTDVQPRSISLLGGSYDLASIEELIESLPADERPNMADLSALTLDETKEAVEGALGNASGFLFSILMQSNGISGSLTLSEISIDARIRQGAP